MTAIEHQELKGITIKNLVLTVVSTASIVASVMTTYFNLRSDIMEIRSSQQAEAKINNIRIKVLEDEVAVLQKEVDKIKFLNADYVPAANHSSSPRPASAALLSSIKK